MIGVYRMQTRMEKYTDTHEDLGQRYKKNEELYKEISNKELDKYTVKTNATVLDDNGTNIDVEHIKKILDTKYNSSPKRKSIVIPEDLTEEVEAPIETKEYDINLILEKAKENEAVDYEKNRFKKLRDTQYDILKDIKLSNPSNAKEEEPDKDELRELINTITQKELENRKQNEDPLDLFPELKGDENTVVLDGMKEELDKITKDVDIPDDESLENSFYTASTQFTQSDFDDFEDLKKEVKGHKVILIIVTILIVIAILLCIYFLLDKFLGINFFKG